MRLRNLKTQNPKSKSRRLWRTVAIHLAASSRGARAAFSSIINYLSPKLFHEKEVSQYMAPIKASRTKSASSKGSKIPKKSSALGSNTKGRVSKTARPKAPPPKQQKTKSNTGPVKKKKPVYTDKELGVPKLNMITPVGVDQPKGKKKGKVFVDDQVSLRGFIQSSYRIIHFHSLTI